MLEKIETGNDFLNRTPINQKLRAKINKSDYIKLKALCTSKETTTKINRQPRE
jgi:hypothetical protein